MEYIVRAAAGANLQTTQLVGAQLEIKPNSSLNQKFGIQETTALAQDDDPSMQYVVIGNKGHRMITGPDNIPYPEPQLHTPNHAGLYNHLPFVLRLPNEDLTPQERVNYRLRRIEQHDNVTYVAYYAKKLDMSATSPTLELRTVDGDTVTSTPFNYTLDDLNPTPPNVPPGQTLVTGSDYIASTSKVPFKLTANDITELLNAVNIIYGNDNYAIISEIGLCHGADRVVPGDFNGATVGYTEVIGCQITTFVSSFFAAKFMNNGIDVTFDVGSVEPMLVLSGV